MKAAPLPGPSLWAVIVPAICFRRQRATVQPESVAILAGGKAMGKEPRQILRCNPFAVILDADRSSEDSPAGCGNPARSVIWCGRSGDAVHRVLGIADEVDQDLQHQMPIRAAARAPRQIP